MSAHDAIRRACRVHLAGLQVCTTGPATLEATPTGYARASGSFLADGFAVGMEVTPSGFTQAETGVITAVTATTMTIEGGRFAEGPSAGRALAVGLPSAVAWEQVRFTPPPLPRPYAMEEYLPGGSILQTFPITSGTVELLPIYAVTVVGLAGVDSTALARYADAVCRHFRPGAALVIAGVQVAVRGNPAPSVAQVVTGPEGRAIVRVSIPLRAFVPST